jgi:hypothetical protein
MLERELDLAYSLFRVQVPKGRAAQACRSEKESSGGVTPKSAFRKDDVHSLLLNSHQFLQTEVTIGQGVSDACQVNGEIICPSVFVLQCTARHGFPCVVTFIKKHLVLFSLVAGGIFLVAKCFESCECGAKFDILHGFPVSRQDSSWRSDLTWSHTWLAGRGEIKINEVICAFGEF